MKQKNSGLLFQQYSQFSAACADTQQKELAGAWKHFSAQLRCYEVVSNKSGLFAFIPARTTDFNQCVNAIMVWTISIRIQHSLLFPRCEPKLMPNRPQVVDADK